MKKPKISIIVPVYNVEQYIKRCMDSLLDQDFEDYEIVVVNDGTPDNSMTYVESLQHTTDKIIVCNRENGGLSAARNTGVEKASGEYLLFCDSDDAIKSTCLSMLHREANLNKLDMLLFDSDIIPEGEGIDQNELNCLGRTEINQDIMTGMEMMKELIEKGKYAASACNYLVKRSLLFENDISFYEGILHEDELFTPTLLAKAERVAHRNWMLYERYVHVGSITTSESYKKRMEGMAIVIKELAGFCDKSISENWQKEVFEKNIMSLIREFLGQTAKLKKPGELLKRKVVEIRKLARMKGWNLGLKFEAYIIYVKLKKYLGMTVCI